MLLPPSGLGSTRSTKPPKTENLTVKVGPAGVGLASLGSKDDRGMVGPLVHQNISTVNSIPGIIVKEEVKSVFQIQRTYRPAGLILLGRKG